MSRLLNLVLTSNEDPVEELFQLIQTNSEPGENGAMDLKQAEVRIDVSHLRGAALEQIMQAGWNGVQWNWNAKSVHLVTPAVSLQLRTVKPAER